jgi:HAD superfamily hydrolase (TIGR01490 family)
LVQDWFGQRPLYDERGQPISLPQWTFPGRGRVQRQLQQAVRLMDVAERGLRMVPFRRKQAEWAAKLEDRQALAERALGYTELYGAYAETEARYRIDRLLSLFESLDPEDQARFCFDPAVIDWAHYVSDVHLPSVVRRGRVRTAPGRPGGTDRQGRLRAAVLSPERHLAVFDLEHTLIASNVVDSYAWLASRHMEPDQRVGFVADLLASAPRWLNLDRRDRADFLRFFYRRYEGAPVAEIERDAWDLFHQFLLRRSFPEGIARVRHHRRLGHRTLLITGALDVVVAPLRPLFDDVVCASLSERDGTFTGRLTELSPIGEARALMLDAYADEHGLSLAESIAYADSSSDLAMLEAVGFPVAVNPDSRLAAIARRRGWLVEHWQRASGGTDRFLPLGGIEPRSLTSGAGGFQQ